MIRDGTTTPGQLRNRPRYHPVDELLAGGEVVDHADHLAGREHAGGGVPIEKPPAATTGKSI